MGLASIRTEAEGCQCCSLARSRNKVVFGGVDGYRTCRNRSDQELVGEPMRPHLLAGDVKAAAAPRIAPPEPVPSSCRSCAPSPRTGFRRTRDAAPTHLGDLLVGTAPQRARPASGVQCRMPASGPRGAQAVCSFGSVPTPQASAPVGPKESQMPGRVALSPPDSAGPSRRAKPSRQGWSQRGVHEPKAGAAWTKR